MKDYTIERDEHGMPVRMGWTQPETHSKPWLVELKITIPECGDKWLLVKRFCEQSDAEEHAQGMRETASERETLRVRHEQITKAS